MKQIRLFRDPGAGDGGAPPLPKSLTELDAPSTEDLAAAAQRAADEQAAAQAAADAAKALETEALNEDGTLKEGYTKDEAGVITKAAQPEEIAAAEAAAATDAQQDGNFWDDVDALRGEPLGINWDELKDANGNPISPESPEGALYRENFVIKKTIDDFETYLKTTDPRSYAYMLHRQAGGSDEDFMAVKAAILPEYEAFKASTDAQAALYKQSLISKGLDPELAQLQVDKAIKDGKIFEYGDKEYAAQKATNEKQLADIEAANKRQNEEYVDKVNKLNTTITSIVNENKALKFIIPETDKPKFIEFVKSSVRYDSENKTFSIVQDIKEENNARLLESLFLLYKGGDLKGLIQREAKTENVRKLQRVIDKSKLDKHAAEQKTDKKDFIALGDI